MDFRVWHMGEGPDSCVTQTTLILNMVYLSPLQNKRCEFFYLCERILFTTIKCPCGMEWFWLGLWGGVFSLTYPFDLLLKKMVAALNISDSGTMVPIHYGACVALEPSE